MALLEKAEAKDSKDINKDVVDAYIKSVIQAALQNDYGIVLKVGFAKDFKEDITRLLKRRMKFTP